VIPGRALDRDIHGMRRREKGMNMDMSIEQDLELL
jgi:hypothetical protein